MNRKRIILLCLCFACFLLAGWQQAPSSPQQSADGINQVNNNTIFNHPYRYNNQARYVISEKRLALTTEKEKSVFNTSTDERVYAIQNVYDDKTRKSRGPLTISVYDSITGEPIPKENFETVLTNEEYLREPHAFFYEGMLIIVTNKRVLFYDIEGDNYGTKAGELRIPMPFSKIK